MCDRRAAGEKGRGMAVALNNKLYCPGCGGFIIHVERVAFDFELSCTRCRQDLEFARQPIKAKILPNGKALKPRMIVWFPDTVED
jgi:hypothetical protein